ncbi:MAG: hypothetical protein EOM69_12010 [Clostridia bacterium]|nr:hypothetical protein [Clostridia bacterium]
MGAIVRFSVLAVLALSACTPSPGESPSAPTSAGTTPATSPAETTTIAVFFDNTEMNPNAENCSAVCVVERTVPPTDDEATAALEALLAGPTPDEEAEARFACVSHCHAGRTADSVVRCDDGRKPQ